MAPTGESKSTARIQDSTRVSLTIMNLTVAKKYSSELHEISCFSAIGAIFEEPEQEIGFSLRQFVDANQAECDDPERDCDQREIRTLALCRSRRM